MPVLGFVDVPLLGLVLGVLGRTEGLDGLVLGVLGRTEGLEGRVLGLTDGLEGRVLGLTDGLEGRVLGLTDGLEGRVLGRLPKLLDRLPPKLLDRPPLAWATAVPKSLSLGMDAVKSRPPHANPPARTKIRKSFQFFIRSLLSCWGCNVILFSQKAIRKIVAHETRFVNVDFRA